MVERQLHEPGEADPAAARREFGLDRRHHDRIVAVIRGRICRVACWCITHAERCRRTLNAPLRMKGDAAIGGRQGIKTTRNRLNTLAITA
jgi:hypothetical protein